MGKLINSQGQFFSPDLIIAVLIFIFVLFIFINASNFVITQVNTFEFKNSSDVVAHTMLDNLVLSPGNPIDWDEKGVISTGFFGIASEKNIIDENKVITLVNLLDSNYSATKEKLGLGGFGFKFNLIDFNGSVIYSSDHNISSAKDTFYYDRVALMGARQVIVEVVVSNE